MWNQADPDIHRALHILLEQLWASHSAPPSSSIQKANDAKDLFISSNGNGTKRGKEEEGGRKGELRCVVHMYQVPTMNVIMTDCYHVLIKIKKIYKVNDDTYFIGSFQVVNEVTHKMLT